MALFGGLFELDATLLTVAAGAVVKEGSVFPPYSLIAGVPATRRGDIRWRDDIEREGGS